MLLRTCWHGGFYDGTHSGNLITIPIVDLDVDDPVDSFTNKKDCDLKSISVYQWIYNGAAAGSANVLSESLDETVTDASEDAIRIATEFLSCYGEAAPFIAVNDVKVR